MMTTISIENSAAVPCGYLIVADDGRTRLVQVDYDYPGVASAFGWSVREVQADCEAVCNHTCTDGTIDCPECGVTAGEFIAAAAEYLDDEPGPVDDPGYFEGGE